MGFDGKLALFMTLYLGGFAVSLLAAPSALFAGSSPVAYWSAELGPEACFFARMFGLSMLVLALGGSLLSVGRDIYIRQCLLFNLLAGYLMYVAAFELSTSVALIWQANLGLQALVLAANVYAVYSDRDRGLGITTDSLVSMV